MKLTQFVFRRRTMWTLISVLAFITLGCQAGITQIEKQAQPVHVELYYESLCPYCKEFILDQLYPTLNKLKDSGIMTVDTYPYGNADETQLTNGTWEFTCQHGPRECAWNMIFACITERADRKAEKYLGPIVCITEGNFKPDLGPCLSQYLPGVSAQEIEECALGKEGNDLIHEYALKTESLVPPRRYVPHLVLNGVHTEDIQEEAQMDLLGYVCKNYNGELPSECNGA